MSKLEETAHPYLAAQGEAEVAPSAASYLCMGCERALEKSEVQFFMTTYPGSDERQDYWGRLHDGCRPPDWVEQLLNNADRGEPPAKRPKR